MTTEKLYFGKYRGKCTFNVDPEGRGRIQVSCAEVLGTGSMSWANPCVPYAGPSKGVFMIPPVGADVWVEFEGGRKDAAIWAGCFWGDLFGAPGLLDITKIIKTEGFTLTITDVAPGVATMDLEIATPVPLKVSAGPAGLTVEYGANKISMDGVVVNINNGALEVM